MAKSYKELMNTITTFIFDVDGVLTNGMIHITPQGELLRVMNIRDGYALKTAIENGYNVCIISGGSNEGVRIRLENLGIKDIFLGISNKKEIYEQYIAQHHLDKNQILYMGDDIPDFEPMQLCGLPCCPQDAAPEIKQLCSYISHIKGGEGAVRDVIEQVMKVQNKWKEHFDAKLD